MNLITLYLYQNMYVFLTQYLYYCSYCLCAYCCLAVSQVTMFKISAWLHLLYNNQHESVLSIHWLIFGSFIPPFTSKGCKRSSGTLVTAGKTLATKKETLATKGMSLATKGCPWWPLGSPWKPKEISWCLVEPPRRPGWDKASLPPARPNVVRSHFTLVV